MFNNFLFIFLILGFVTCLHIDCPQLPPRKTPIKNVWDLRIDDIDAMLAMGDSITAACFAESKHLDDLLEYRKDSFGIGANPDTYTLFNLVKYFNPNVVGGSVGDTIPIDALKFKFQNLTLKYINPDITRLNAGISMAKVEDLWAEIDYLIKEMPKYDTANKNVVGTLLVGANNLCVEQEHNSIPDNWIKNLDGVIQDMYDRLPYKRFFLNVVAQFNISQVWTLSSHNTYCKDFHELFHGECPSLNPPSTSADRQKMDLLATEYNTRLFQLEAKWKAKNLDNFAVVVQPFTQNLQIFNLTYLSDLDCFHPSKLAHSELSLALFQNMVSPPPKINTLPKQFKLPNCPTEDDRLH